ncbi:hypothetical protein OQA88_1584 [Cercophora sp. LCS_1]
MPEERPCANPLYLEWVKEWWETARQRNTKGVNAYKHAYDALKACPIVFEHPSQVQQLRGFGPKLAERLTQRLEEHCEQNGLPMPKRPTRKRSQGPNVNPWERDSEEEDEEEPARPAKKPRKTKTYVPAYRSGPYALMLILSLQDENSSVGMTKADLIEAAQPHCDASFTIPTDTNRFYTAWNSIKTLESKELIYQRGRPLKRYALTDEGWETAKKIREVAVRKGEVVLPPHLRRVSPSPASGAGASGPSGTQPPSQSNSSRQVSRPIFLDDDDDEPFMPNPGGYQGYDNGGSFQDEKSEATGLRFEMGSRFEESQTQTEHKSLIPDGNLVKDDSQLPAFTPIRLKPGEFTVELILDVREVRAKNDRDYMQNELIKKGCPPTMKALEVGDALWVARCNKKDWLRQMGADCDEVVLDWIVERKRLDDLISSIKDGRFHEQKFRLRRSGIQNVIYVVEDKTMDHNELQKYDEHIKSAIASIQVVNGYFLKRTAMMDETIKYLASMTRLLKKVYENKPLHIVPTEVLTAKNHLPLMKHLKDKHPDIGHYISYDAFSDLTSKSEMMNLRDLYLKMLMCTRGVTGEKAIEIQKVWKTPHEFVSALEQQGGGTSEEAKKKRGDYVFTKLNHLVGRKKIPKAVCQKIAEVWGGTAGYDD